MVKKVEVSSQHTKDDSDPKLQAAVNQTRSYENKSKAARRKKVSDEFTIESCRALTLLC